MTLIGEVSSSSAEHAEVILLRRHFHSSAVSLPSFPSLEESGVLADEVVLLDLDFSCPDLDELPPELEGLGDEVDWDLEE